MDFLKLRNECIYGSLMWGVVWLLPLTSLFITSAYILVKIETNRWYTLLKARTELSCITFVDGGMSCTVLHVFESIFRQSGFNM